MSDPTERCGIYTRAMDPALGGAPGRAERQQQACEARAAELGWPVAGVYADTVCGGPGYQQLLADLRSGVVTNVVTHDVSRLARSLRALSEVAEAMEAAGGEVRTADGGSYSLDAPAAALMGLLVDEHRPRGRRR